MKKYTCKTCGKTFFSYNVNPSFCNLNCKGIYQIKDLPEKEIIKSYIDGKTLIEIKKIYGGSQKSITNVLKRNNVDLRKAVKRDQKGEKNASWKGGVYVSPESYRFVRLYDHERKGYYIQEHRLKTLGIEGGDLIVHHKNGDKLDNRLENLEVMTRADHNKLHNDERRQKKKVS